MRERTRLALPERSVFLAKKSVPGRKERKISRSAEEGTCGGPGRIGYGADQGKKSGCEIV